jgi:acyl-CoA thioesterase I
MVNTILIEVIISQMTRKIGCPGIFWLLRLFLHHIMWTATKSDNNLIISCVGDSITAGSHATDKTKSSYPAVLQKMIASCDSTMYTNHTTLNFGKGGTTVSKTGKADDRIKGMSYWSSEEYQNALHTEANIVVIGFGTNDAKRHNWKGEEAFISDYTHLIHSFQDLPTKPTIFICIPPPLYLPFSDVQTDIIKHVYPRVIVDIAKRNGAKVIDLHSVLGGRELRSPQLFLDPGKPIRWPNDGCHPNDLGYIEIARAVAKEILRDQDIVCDL